MCFLDRYPVDIIRVMVILCKISMKINKTVICCMYSLSSCMQTHMTSSDFVLGFGPRFSCPFLACSVVLTRDCLFVFYMVRFLCVFYIFSGYYIQLLVLVQLIA